MRFIQLKNGETKLVKEEIKDGWVSAVDKDGNEKVINPADIEKEVTKWYQILMLVLQFWKQIKLIFG